jgi:hypothetical protein
VQKAITFSLDLVVNRVSERYHNIKEGWKGLIVVIESKLYSTLVYWRPSLFPLSGTLVVRTIHIGISKLHLLATCFTLVSSLAYSLTLKMEATCFSETSVDFQRTTRFYIPEDGTLHLLVCDKWKEDSKLYAHNIIQDNILYVLCRFCK